jgi:hypothetical protein
VILVDIDGLSRSISKGKKEKLCKKTKMGTISHKKDREIVDVSSQDREYNDDISDTKVLSLNVLLQIIILRHDFFSKNWNIF